MIPSWLLLWATFQVGYVPLDWQTVTIHDQAYVEPGFAATFFGVLTIEGSIRTYIDPSYWRKTGASFWVDRDTYTFRVHADPFPWLQVGFLHWCTHPVVPFGVTEWPGDAGAIEWYAKVRVGF